MKKPSGKTATGKRRGRVLSRRRKPAIGKPVSAVFLVGFMGAGKSSVGRTLGQQLNWAFEDLDDRIERQEGRTVAEIFRDCGEREFRRAEHTALANLLAELTGGKARVIALGGGAFVQQQNARLLQAAGVSIVFLDASVEELWRRCVKQAGESGAERPLLRSQEQFRKLFAARRKGYAQAPIRVRTGNRSVDEISREVAEVLGLKRIEARIQEGEVE